MTGVQTCALPISRSQTVSSTVIAATDFFGTSGSYTTRSGAATTLSGGSGTSCTVTLVFGIGTVTVSGAGTNYSEFLPPSVASAGATAVSITSCAVRSVPDAPAT